MTDLITAIQLKQVVMFTYKHRIRKAEVYALGVSKAGNLVVRCYELHTKGFKLFLVDDIKGLRLLPQQWTRVRSGYSKDDKSMVEVLAQV